MKLRTQIDACLPRGTVGDIEHDAMVARALLQAMEIVLTDPAYCALSRKAAEILAGWMVEE